MIIAATGHANRPLGGTRSANVTVHYTVTEGFDARGIGYPIL